jgi:hypothetical protein
MRMVLVGEEMKLHICQICGKDDKVYIELISHEVIRRSRQYIFCRACWNKYYHPAMAVVTGLLDENKQLKKGILDE